MVTFDELVRSNLEMLSEQEAMVLKSLDFIRRAKEIFATNGSEATEPKTRKRRRRRSARRNKSIPASVVVKEQRLQSEPRKETHMDRILSVLQSAKGPVSSGELIDNLFKGQSATKDIAKFRQLIYPVLTGAYKKGILKNKKRKIYIG